jgi:hypothetical protein
LQARVGKPTAKGVVRPLKEKVRNCVEHRVLVDGFLLELDAGNFAEPVLIVLEDSTGKKLIENLGLSSGEGH